MAYIEKKLHPSGSLVDRARIRVKGSPKISETFPSRKLAKEWAARMEAEIRAGRYFQKEERHEKTFGEFIDRYIEKELPKNPKSLPKLKLLPLWECLQILFIAGAKRREVPIFPSFPKKKEQRVMDFSMLSNIQKR